MSFEKTHRAAEPELFEPSAGLPVSHIERLNYGERLLGRPVIGHDEAQAVRSVGRQRPGLHSDSPAFASLPEPRWCERSSSRSCASFSAHDSPSIEMISARCPRRSTSERVQAASGNTSCHSDSVGLFQLNRTGGEGKNFSVAQLLDPDFNINVALDAVSRFPSFRAADSLDSAVEEFERRFECPADTDAAVVARQRIVHSLYASA